MSKWIMNSSIQMQIQHLRNLNKVKLLIRLRTKEVIKEERKERGQEGRIKVNIRREICKDTNLEVGRKELHLPKEVSSTMVA